MSEVLSRDVEEAIKPVLRGEVMYAAVDKAECRAIHDLILAARFVLAEGPTVQTAVRLQRALDALRPKPKTMWD